MFFQVRLLTPVRPDELEGDEVGAEKWRDRQKGENCIVDADKAKKVDPFIWTIN